MSKPRAIRQAEVGAARTMLERTEDRFGLKPDYLTADSAYGSAESLAWLVKHSSNRRRSHRTFRSSTSPPGRTGRFRAPTSLLIPKGTDIRARRGTTPRSSQPDNEIIFQREDDEDDANEVSPTIQFMSPKDDTDEA